MSRFIHQLIHQITPNQKVWASTVLVACLATTAMAEKEAAATKASKAKQEFTYTAVGFPEAKQGRTFYSRISTYPKALNYWISGDVYAQAINGGFILEGLITSDSETLEELPGLAESWEMAPDLMSMTIKINKKAKWSDGTPLTADDVLFTWDTIFNEKNNTASYRGFYDSLKSWKKIDSHTVKYEFNYADCDNVTKVGGAPIMQKSVYSKGDFNRDFTFTAVGSGPYVYDKKESKKGRLIVLRKNKDYWGKDLPRMKHVNNFDKIVFTVYEDDRVAFEAFKKGQLSWLEFTGDALDIYAKELSGKEWDGSGKFQKLSWPAANPVQWNGIALNMHRGPTRDLEFRQALQSLFNYKSYTEKLFHGMQVPLLGPFGNYSDYGSPKRKLVEFSPANAKKLLAAAGYKKTDKDGVLYKEVDGKKQRAEITIMFAYLPHEKYLTIFKEDAKKVGIKLDLKFTEWAAGMKLVDDRKFDAFVIGWSGNPEPAPSQLWHGKFATQHASSNLPGFNDPKVNDLIEKAAGVCESSKRKPLFHEIEERIIAAQPYLWRWQQKEFYFVYNKELVTPPKKIWKYSGNSTRGIPISYWWHPKGK